MLSHCFHDKSVPYIIVSIHTFLCRTVDVKWDCKKIIQFVCHFVKRYIMVIGHASNAQVNEIASFSDNVILRADIVPNKMNPLCSRPQKAEIYEYILPHKSFLFTCK